MPKPIIFLLFVIIGNTLSSTNDCYDNDEKNYSCNTFPPWFTFDKAAEKCQCGSRLGATVICDNANEKVYIDHCYCMTHDDHLGTIAGACMTNCFIKKPSLGDYYELPSNLSELNKVMCENRWNRSGRLCGKCKDGHHPLVYSYDMKCVQCKGVKYNWLTFIVVAFVPLTLFFIFVIGCGISASSPQLEAFVVYAQTIATPANVRIVLAATMIEYNYASAAFFCQVIAALYGIWNLDFFRTLLPPICLKLSTLQALALDYLIAFYPLVLIIITYVLIDLYDRNFCLLVWLWKPFRKCLKGDVNVKPAFINAFVTFLILSYVKLLSVSFDLLAYVNVYNSSGENVGTFLFYDASIGYFGQEHLPYAILAIFVVILFLILPLAFSLLHPLRCLNGCIGRWPSLRICLDSFQGYYKDGTDGTRDCRWFSSLYLLSRIMLFLVYGLVKESFYSFASIMLLFLIALIIIFQPFKPQYGVYNTIHSLLFLNLAMWFMTVVFTPRSRSTTFALTISAIVAILPLFYITGLVFKWVYSRKLCYKHFILKICCCLQRSDHGPIETDSIDSIPYRLEYEQHDERKFLNDSGNCEYGTID